jgi:hypothetical protein
VPIRTFEYNMIRCPKSELTSVPEYYGWYRWKVSQVDERLGAIVDFPDFVRVIEFGPGPFVDREGVFRAGGVSTFHFDSVRLMSCRYRLRLAGRVRYPTFLRMSKKMCRGRKKGKGDIGFSDDDQHQGHGPCRHNPVSGTLGSYGKTRLGSLSSFPIKHVGLAMTSGRISRKHDFRKCRTNNGCIEVFMFTSSGRTDDILVTGVVICTGTLDYVS